MGLFRRTSDDYGRLPSLQPIGVLDIGSNSVRLVVYEGAQRAVTPLFNEKELCGLGKLVAASGRLGEEGIERTIAVLTRFKAIADLLEVRELSAIATAAVRDAEDGSEFIAQAEKLLRVKICILSGKREAQLAAQGVIMGFGEVDGMVGDLGGGSLELVDLRGKRPRHATTLGLGGLRLRELSGGRIDKAAAIVERELDSVPWLEDGKDRPFFAVGGTWRAFARLQMRQTDYPLHVMQGYRIRPADAIARAIEVHKAKKLEAVEGIDAVSKSRRDVLPFGALVLDRILMRIQPRNLTFSVFGVREGKVWEMLSEKEKARDPLLSFCEDYSRLRSRSPEHARELCDWTAKVFTHPKLGETEEEARLRKAACLLSDIAWRAHPDYRGEQSLNVIAHAALTGIDHPGRLFIALTIYHRHEGQGADTEDYFSGRLKSELTRRAQKRARVLGAALRAVHMLSVGRAGIIPHADLTFHGGTMRLTIPKKYELLNGERLQRRFQTLADLVDCQLEIKLGP